MLTLIREGVEYSLTDGSLCYFIGQDGWGMAPLHRLNERGPMQHGHLDLGFRLDPRVGSLVLTLPGESHADLYSRRSQLINLFGPLESTPISLEWEVNGLLRRIDCHYVGDMGFPSSERQGYAQNVGVTLVAPDPTFYDPAGAAVTFSLGGGSGGFTVPMEVPHEVGASVIDATTALNYLGDWQSNPHLIRIIGPIDNCVITNETTGEKLDFTGVNINPGDYYDIDTRFGFKTVRDSLGANKIADLSDDSDLATWHLQPGINSIRVAGINITEATRVDINYLERYLGI